MYGQSIIINHLSKIMISQSLKVMSGQCHILSMAYCKDHSIARLHEANARLHGQCYVDVDRHICILWQRGQVCRATRAIFDWYICTDDWQMIQPSSNTWALPLPNCSNKSKDYQIYKHTIQLYNWSVCGEEGRVQSSWGPSASFKTHLEDTF